MKRRSVGYLGLVVLICLSCSIGSTPTDYPQEPDITRPLSPHLPPGCEDPETDPDCWLRAYTVQDWDAIWSMLDYIDTSGPQICRDARNFWVSVYVERPPYPVIYEDVRENGEQILGEYHNWDRIELYSPSEQSDGALARIAVHEFLHGRWWDDGLCSNCTHTQIYAQAAQCTAI